jgi:hypothetical protein
MSYNVARTRLTNYDVTWNSVALGSVDKVTPDLKMKTVPIKVGSVGDVVLGERIIALEGTIKVEAREIDRAQYAALMPWSSTGSIPLLPATVHEDLYSYAEILTLHPIDLASATTEDITLIKAVPMVEFFDSDGKKDNNALVTFSFYPDRTQLPTLAYGYLGPAPS